MSQLSASSIALIEASQGASSWRSRRVEVFDLPEGKVIVKGQRPKRGPWRHRLLKWIGTLLRSPVIRPVPVPGGEVSQAIEIKRLTQMSASAVPVPQVLHVTNDYFVMRYLGATDLAVQLRELGFEAFELWRQAAIYLIQTHDSGQYLSQSFARNIVIDRQAQDFFVAGLIDFEDDPLVVMSLLDAQVRDWLLFLQSTLYGLNAPESALQPVLTELLNRENPAVRDAVLLQSRSLVWMRHLPTSRKIFGKDL
ncbi:MAG: hypothetical protein HC765_11105 [Brachymonas sp.]|nr:hypothetical protein [Brachymonas sp.]